MDKPELIVAHREALKRGVEAALGKTVSGREAMDVICFSLNQMTQEQREVFGAWCAHPDRRGN